MSEETVLTPREALASIAAVSRRDEALKARTEGLTWVLWGFANTGVIFTYLALGPNMREIPPLWQIPPWYVASSSAWIVACLLATVGLWKSAALSIPTGMTWRRGVAFFVAFPLLTAVLTLLALPFVGWENGVLAKTVAIGILLLGFGGLNPLGFTARGRASALVLGAFGIVLGLAGLLLSLDLREALLVMAAGLGGSWVAVGLFAVYRD